MQFLSTNLSTFMTAARKRPEIAGLSTTFLASVPQQFVDVDEDKVLKQGVPISDVYKTIQAFMGGLFVNYFNRSPPVRTLSRPKAPIAPRRKMSEVLRPQ